MTVTKRTDWMVIKGIGWGKRSTAWGRINWLRKKLDRQINRLKERLDQLRRSDRLKRKIDE
jgi:ribosome-associated translation inhibitor RaiA